MSITHNLSIGLSRSGELISKSVALASGAEQIVDETIPAPSTDLAIAFALVRAKCQGFFMVCDQNITIETNSASTPTDTLALVANKPICWYPDFVGFALSELFTADVTALYATLAGGTAALLQIRHLYDPT